MGSVDVLLHPADDRETHRPHPRGRLSTVGHGAAFRAFVRAARRAKVPFMIIGGTYRDVAVRASSTREIDVVLVDAQTLPKDVMHEAGFVEVEGSPHAWRFAARRRSAIVEIAAVASSRDRKGPFSIAFHEAENRTIEGLRVRVPRIEDYVILKLLAADADPRRRGRDLADVQFAFEAHAEHSEEKLSVAALRGRLRDVYGVSGEKLRRITGFLRALPRPTTMP